MKFETKPLTVNHFYEMNSVTPDMKVKLQYGKGFTLFCDGKPVAMGGVVSDPIRPGVGKAWTIQTFEAQESHLMMRRIHEAVKRKFAEVKENFVRIECETFVNSARHYNWLIFFGFEFEGVSRLYTGSEDRARFAYVGGVPSTK